MTLAFVCILVAFIGAYIGLYAFFLRARRRSDELDAHGEVLTQLHIAEHNHYHENTLSNFGTPRPGKTAMATAWRGAGEPQHAQARLHVPSIVAPYAGASDALLGGDSNGFARYMQDGVLAVLGVRRVLWDLAVAKGKYQPFFKWGTLF